MPNTKNRSPGRYLQLHCGASKDFSHSIAPSHHSAQLDSAEHVCLIGDTLAGDVE